MNMVNFKITMPEGLNLIIGKPNSGDMYCYIDLSSQRKFNCTIWTGSLEDEYRYENGLIQVSQDECVIKADILLNTLKYIRFGGNINEKCN
jgi:hypothetical protein